MKVRSLHFLCFSLALVIGGCPKRQAPPRIVYVPSPPPAVTTQAPASAGKQEIVVEEPAPPEEPPTPSPQPPVEPPKPVHHPRHRTEPAAEDTESVPEPEPTLPVPSLEPRESSSQEAALRRQIQSLQGDVRDRITRLNGAELSVAERKTLDDARTFFTQSTRALNEGDLQRALTLARKASLLVAALER